MTDTPEFDEELFKAACDARLNAHAPYSGFAVGAALRCADGTIVTGANFENASLGLSLCAETVALASSNSMGKLGEITGLAVAGARIDTDRAATNEVLTPCGRCRQILAEAALLASRDIPVYCADIMGGQRRVYLSSQLLPHAFTAAAFIAGHEIEGP